MSGAEVLLLLAILSTGLVAGLLFGWSVSVIPGTRRIPDDAYVTTMQSVNLAIINPSFLVPFLGTPALLAVAALVEVSGGGTARGYWLGAAAAAYGVGVLGVTIGGNVPLNNRLAELDRVEASAVELAEGRSAYEGEWNRWHRVRMTASLVAFALAAAAALTEGGG